MDLTDGGNLLFVLALAGILWAVALWYAAVNTDREDFKTFMEEVRGMFSQILEKLPEPVVRRASPIQLTTLGVSMATENCTFLATENCTLQAGAFRSERTFSR
ncbi:MAG: hypothetical protein OXH99_08015 [Bryobacterales bacterium]|nr:hypothetical protein [Bryobacterales bacterium]